jgi:uncharacterized membrane protein
MVMHNIYRSASYFYYVMKFFGMAPYTFDRKALKFHTTFSDYLRLVGTLIAWIYINFIHIRTYDNRRYKLGIKFKIVDSLWVNCYFLQNLSVLVILIFNFVKRKSVENFLKSIHEFDVQIHKLGWSFKENSCKFLRHTLPLGLLVLTLILLWHLIMSWNGIVSYERFDFYLKYLGFVEVVGIFFIINMTFIGSCCCIANRLDMMTDSLR